MAQSGLTAQNVRQRSGYAGRAWAVSWGDWRRVPTIPLPVRSTAESVRHRSPVAGKCPDCGRVVPVPASAPGPSMVDPASRPSQADPEARTDELDNNDRAQLERWSTKYTTSVNQPEENPLPATGLHLVGVGTDPRANLGAVASVTPPTSAVKFEAGLRVLPSLQKACSPWCRNLPGMSNSVPRQ